MSCSSEIDERTFREIYLAAFETAVKEGRPDTVMCSYNKINGTFASENQQAAYRDPERTSGDLKDMLCLTGVQSMTG